MKKILSTVSIVFFLLILLWFLPYVSTLGVIRNLDVSDTHINSITTGSGDSVEINESFEMLVINKLSEFSYRPYFTVLPRGGWGFSLELEQGDKNYVLVVSRDGLIKFDGMRYRVVSNEDWEDFIVTLESY